MKKLLFVVIIIALLLAVAMPALAHKTGPCDSGDGEGYALHHIVPRAIGGELGAGGHIPGTHHGFSACNPSG